MQAQNINCITKKVTATQYSPLELCAPKYSHKAQATVLGACFKRYGNKAEVTRMRNTQKKIELIEKLSNEDTNKSLTYAALE